MAIEAGDVVGRLKFDVSEAVSNLQQFSQRGREELNGLAGAARPVGREFDGIGQAASTVGQRLSNVSRETQQALQQQGAAARSAGQEIKSSFGEELLRGIVAGITQAAGEFGILGRAGVENANQIKTSFEQAALAIKAARPDTGALEALGRQNAGATADFLGARTRFGFATGAEAESLRLIQQGAAEFARYGQAGVESFDSIRAAAESANASIRSTTQTTAATSRNRQTLFSDSGARLSVGETDQTNFARAEKARAESIKGSQQAWKDFENSIRSGSRNVENSLLTANNATGQLASGIGNLRNVAASLGVALSAAALVQFVTHAATATAKLQDLSDQTGISASRLAAIRPIAENAGSSIEEFATGVRALLRSMVEGTPDVVKAMNDLGISTEQMLRFTNDPEGAIDAMASGLLKLENQGKSVSNVMEVMSRAGFRLVPVLKDIGREGGTAQLKSPLTDQDVAAIDNALDRLNSLKLKIEAIAAISLTPLLNGFADLFGWADRIADKLGGWAEILQKIQVYGAAAALIARGVPAGNALAASRAMFEQKPEDVATNRVRSAATEAVSSGSFQIVPQGQLIRAGIEAQMAAVAPKAGIDFSKGQEQFLKSLRDSNLQLEAQQALITQNREAAIQASADILAKKAEEFGLSAAFQAALKKEIDLFKERSLSIAQGQLADSITQQNRGIEQQITAMTQGKQAAEDAAIANTLAASKLTNYGDAALRAAANQRKLNDELARAQVTNILGPADNSAGLSKDLAVAGRRADVIGPTINQSEQQLQALQKARDALLNDTDPRTQALSKDLAVKLQVQIDQASVNSAIEGSNIGEQLALKQAAVFNKTFGNTINVDAARVETLRNEINKALAGGAKPEALAGLAEQLDTARLKSDLGEIQRGLDQNAAASQIFGRSFDLANANVQTLESGIQKMLNEGLRPSNEEVQKLAAQLKDAKVDAVFSDLSKDTKEAAVEAAVFGGSFDQASANISALTDAIKRLIKEGFTELSPEIQDLKAQLEDQKAFQTMKDTANDLFDVLQRGATRQIKTWKDFGLEIKRVLDSAASQVLKQQFDDLLSSVFKPPEVKIPGGRDQVQQPVVNQVAITGIQTQAQTAQISINAVRDAALAAIAAARGTPLTTLPTAGGVPAGGAPEIIGEVPANEIFRNFPSPFGVPPPDNQEAFMRDATHLSDELAADLEHAIATGGSLMSRRNELAGITPDWRQAQLESEMRGEGGYYSGTDPGTPAISTPNGPVFFPQGPNDVTGTNLVPQPGTGGLFDLLKLLGGGAGRSTGGLSDIFKIIMTGQIPLPSPVITDRFGPPSPGTPATQIRDFLRTNQESDAAKKIADEGIAAIEKAGTTAEQGITDAGQTSQSGISSLLTTAMQALSSIGIGSGIGGITGGIKNFFTGGSPGITPATQLIPSQTVWDAGKVVATGATTVGSLMENPLAFLGGLAMAKGGKANANQPYTVGDAGEPELFLPKMNLASMDFSSLKPSAADGMRAQWVGKDGVESFTPRVPGEIVPLEKVGQKLAEARTKFPQVDYSSVLNGRMNGGDVNANQSFTVGEGGLPELFLPDTRGSAERFVSRSGGRGGNVTNHIYSPNFENRRSSSQVLAKIGAASKIAGSRNG